MKYEPIQTGLWRGIWLITLFVELSLLVAVTFLDESVFAYAIKAAFEFYLAGIIWRAYYRDSDCFVYRWIMSAIRQSQYQTEDAAFIFVGVAAVEGFFFVYCAILAF